MSRVEGAFDQKIIVNLQRNKYFPYSTYIYFKKKIIKYLNYHSNRINSIFPFIFHSTIYTYLTKIFSNNLSFENLFLPNYFHARFFIFFGNNKITRD